MKNEIASMQDDLNKYEKQYNMNSSVFFEQFETGKLEDKKNILWFGIYEIQLNSNQKSQKYYDLFCYF